MAQPEPLVPYVPPQPAFFRCRCGSLVLRIGKGPVLTPCLGLPHVCALVRRTHLAA